MKYKVGDSVIIKSDLKPGIYYGECIFVKNMCEFLDSIVTIRSITDNYYRIEEDRGNFCWSDDMLEGLVNIKDKDLYKFLHDNSCLKYLNKFVKEKNITNIMLSDELDDLIKGLNRLKKNNVLIIGKTGIGKTALVESLCQKINRHDVPVNLRDKKILEMSLGGLLAGTKYRGEFEEKLNNILQFVINREDIILFIDEIHNLMTCGGAEGAIPGGEILKPYLARREVSIIGATTETEYKNTIFQDKAMNRRFSLLKMNEPTLEVTTEILNNDRKKYENHYGIKLTKEEIENVVIKSKKRTGSFPDKAFDELEEYCYQKLVEDDSDKKVDD